MLWIDNKAKLKCTSFFELFEEKTKKIHASGCRWVHSPMKKMNLGIDPGLKIEC